jgi:PleD family two-component response regulator
MPRFSGAAALEILRARDADLPFIFVSGTIGEDAAVAAMRSGAHDYVMKGHLRRLVPAIRRELREAIVRREHRYGAAIVQHLAYYDQLTDLPNRALLYDRVSKELAAAQREKKPFALMILDLDGFKEVNDILGHGVGDTLLRQVGQRIQGALPANEGVSFGFAKLRPSGHRRLVEQQPIHPQFPHRGGEAFKIHRLDDVAIDAQFVTLNQVSLLFG